jgi:hypothetical protein
MSLFGKLLLVVNLLGAGAFVYLATQDWKGRQTINAAGLRHLLLVSGLPLEGPADFAADDVTEFVVPGPGDVPTRTVSKKLLESYFQAAGSGGEALGSAAPVPNQVAEARRVKKQIDDLLARTEGDAAKQQLLRGWLQLQPETYDERVAILALAAPGQSGDELKRAVEELQKRLAARFDAVINKPAVAFTASGELPDPAAIQRTINDLNLKIAANEDVEANRQAKEAKEAELAAALEKLKARPAQVVDSRLVPLDTDERARKLAHLLVHLSTDAAWQKRVLVVIGLRQYVKVLGAQAKRFAEMSLRVEQQLIADQEAFLDEIRVLATRAEVATEEANRQAAIRAKWVAQALTDADLVAQRETQLKELKDQLVKIKTQVDAMLARQTAIESGLFEIQREVAITLDEIYKLEADLDARERKLAGGK